MIRKDFITVALPKGRLGKKAYRAMEEAGFPCEGVMDDSRQLIFTNREAGIRYFWAKPSDVGIYVEQGAADIGIIGKDILIEDRPDVYELLDLGIGKCRMAVAGKRETYEKHKDSLIVASKFGNIARDYFLSKGKDIKIIHLNGSIELAPILELSHVIVDIVETGNTLRENNLEVLEDIMDISARLIANKAGYEFKSRKIDSIAEKLSER